MTTTATQENMMLQQPNADVFPSHHYRPNFSDKNEYGADVLMQLRANLAQLEDLHARLRFALNEIAYLLKKS